MFRHHSEIPVLHNVLDYRKEIAVLEDALRNRTISAGYAETHREALEQKLTTQARLELMRGVGEPSARDTFQDAGGMTVAKQPKKVMLTKALFEELKSQGFPITYPDVTIVSQNARTVSLELDDASYSRLWELTDDIKNGDNAKLKNVSSAAASRSAEAWQNKNKDLRPANVVNQQQANAEAAVARSKASRAPTPSATAALDESMFDDAPTVAVDDLGSSDDAYLRSYEQQLFGDAPAVGADDPAPSPKSTKSKGKGAAKSSAPTPSATAALDESMFDDAPTVAVDDPTSSPKSSKTSKAPKAPAGLAEQLAPPAPKTAFNLAQMQALQTLARSKEGLPPLPISQTGSADRTLIPSKDQYGAPLPEGFEDADYVEEVRGRSKVDQLIRERSDRFASINAALRSGYITSDEHEMLMETTRRKYEWPIFDARQAERLKTSGLVKGAPSSSENMGDYAKDFEALERVQRVAIDPVTGKATVVVGTSDDPFRDELMGRDLSHLRPKRVRDRMEASSAQAIRPRFRTEAEAIAAQLTEDAASGQMVERTGRVITDSNGKPVLNSDGKRQRQLEYVFEVATDEEVYAYNDRVAELDAAVREGRLSALDASLETQQRFGELSPAGQERVRAGLRNSIAARTSQVADVVLASNLKQTGTLPPAFQLGMSPEHVRDLRAMANDPWDKLARQLRASGYTPMDIPSLGAGLGIHPLYSTGVFPDPYAGGGMGGPSPAPGSSGYIPTLNPQYQQASSPLTPPPVIASPAAQQAARQAIQPLSIPPSSLPAGPTSPFPRQPLSIPPSSLPAGPTSAWPSAGGGAVPPTPPAGPGAVPGVPGQPFNGPLWKAGGLRNIGRTAISRAMGPASLAAFAGPVAGNVLKSVWDDPESRADDTVAGALSSAGMGAALGSVILPGWGTAIGAGAGALYGGLRGWFSGDDTSTDAIRAAADKQISQLNSTFDKLGIDQASRQDLFDSLETQLAFAKSTADVDNIFARTAEQAPTLVSEMRRRSRMAGIQAALLPLMQQADQRAQQRAMASQGWLNQAASLQSDPQVAALLRSQGEQLLSQQAAASQAAYGYRSALPVLAELGISGMGSQMTDYNALLSQLQPTG